MKKKPPNSKIKADKVLKKLLEIWSKQEKKPFVDLYQKLLERPSKN